MANPMHPYHYRTQNSSSTSSPSSDVNNNETGQAVKNILDGRKCWRIMKGRDEVVWPPHLEAALIEGLDKYQPAESRSNRTLGRFPMRNKFISEFIREKTGKFRTPKQVGSRIQQLRDTNAGKQILKTLSDRHYEMMRPKKNAASGAANISPYHASASCSSVGAVHAWASTTTSCHEYYIDVVPPHAHWTPPPSDRLHPTPGIELSATGIIRPLGARRLRDIDPTVTFTAHSSAPCYSCFRVIKDGLIVYSEKAEFVVRPLMQDASIGTYLYKTTLVPQYWSQLCQEEDITSYYITQQVVRKHPHADVMLSVVYRFRDASVTSPYQSPDLRSTGGSSRSFSIESIPDMNSAFPGYSFSTAGCASGHDLGMSSMLPAIAHNDEGYASLPPSPVDLPPTNISSHLRDPVYRSHSSMAFPTQCDSYLDALTFPMNHAGGLDNLPIPTLSASLMLPSNGEIF